MAAQRSFEESDIALIQTVKRMPSLYDPKNNHFRILFKKERDWDYVATALGMSKVLAKRRWTCLRDRYSRELRQKRLNPEKYDCGENEFFRLMDFLRGFVIKRNRRKTRYKGAELSEDSKSDSKTQIQDLPSVDDYEDERSLEDMEHNTEIGTTSTYTDFVGVDHNEHFEEYIEPPSMETNNTCRRSTSVEKPTTIAKITYSATEQPRIPTLQPQPLYQQYDAAQAATIKTRSASTQNVVEPAGAVETEDDYFCKTVAVYLKQLSRRHKIKAKVEMFQVLEKYVELEENPE